MHSRHGSNVRRRVPTYRRVLLSEFVVDEEESHIDNAAYRIIVESQLDECERTHDRYFAVGSPTINQDGEEEPLTFHLGHDESIARNDISWGRDVLEDHTTPHVVVRDQANGSRETFEFSAEALAEKAADFQARLKRDDPDRDYLVVEHKAAGRTSSPWRRAPPTMTNSADGLALCRSRGSPRSASRRSWSDAGSRRTVSYSRRAVAPQLPLGAVARPLQGGLVRRLRIRRDPAALDALAALPRRASAATGRTVAPRRSGLNVAVPVGLLVVARHGSRLVLEAVGVGSQSEHPVVAPVVFVAGARRDDRPALGHPDSVSSVPSLLISD